MDDKDEWFEQFERHLNTPEQNWLLGAGISHEANIPLMGPLTGRVIENIKEDQENYKPEFKLLTDLVSELPSSCHIEHILSHLVDYIAIAKRNKINKIHITGKERDLEWLTSLHELILRNIADLIRFGYKQTSDGKESIGNSEYPLIEIDNHLEFVDAIFNHASAGVSDRRSAINFFSTNYDTLLEDSLSLKQVPFWDGFQGGAVAFKSHKYGENFPNSNQFRANFIKLHGSIDWFMGDDGNIWRVRHNDNYPNKENRVLIYPQATKYVATQHDPFASHFDLFRRALSSGNSNILGVCGYSFRDDHINHEIEISLSLPSNKTTILAFVYENENGLPDVLDYWRKKSRYGDRIFIATQNGLYIGENGPFQRIDEEDAWWKFTGMTKLFKEGVS